MGLTKYQLSHHWELTLEDARVETARLVDQLHGTSDFDEGVRSFVEKRPPNFAPLSSGPGLPPPIP